MVFVGVVCFDVYNVAYIGFLASCVCRGVGIIPGLWGFVYLVRILGLGWVCRFRW